MGDSVFPEHHVQTNAPKRAKDTHLQTTLSHTACHNMTIGFSQTCSPHSVLPLQDLSSSLCSPSFCPVCIQVQKVIGQSRTLPDSSQHAPLIFASTSTRWSETMTNPMWNKSGFSTSLILPMIDFQKHHRKRHGLICTLVEDTLTHS